MGLLTVLVVNAGSTSLKLSLVVAPDGSTPVDSLESVDAAAIAAVGHRLVHGGSRFVEPVILDDAVVEALRAFTELAPLHNASALAAVAEARAALPEHTHVAVFDTAFHATLPPEAATFPVPARWRADGLRRFGFHGLSVEWAAERVPVARLVVCHLGGGCSVTAVRDGASVDTTMGLTPLDGVPMATRSGALDPGLLLYLLRHGVSVDTLEDALEHESGLLGLSERSPHVHELEAAMADGDQRARLALSIFTRRVAQAVAAMSVTLRGLDALVFTGGIGERSQWVREQVCAQLSTIGVEIDPAVNAGARDGDIAAVTSLVRVVVVEAREDVVIARAAVRLLEGSGGSRPPAHDDTTASPRT